MQLNCTKADLAKALSTVGRCVATKSTLPVLSCVLLDLRDTARISATNLSTFITTEFPSEGTWTPGEQFAIPYKRLSDVAASLTADNVSLTSKRDEIEVKCGRSRFNIKTMPAEEFPLVPEFDGYLDVDPTDLAKAIERVSFSSYEDQFSAIGGILLTHKDGRMILVSTDRQRLSVADFPCDGKFGSAIVPAVSMSEMRRVLSGNESCAMSFEEKRVGISAGNTVFFSQTIEGAYPDYNQIVPFDTSLPITAEFYCSEFLGIVKAARVVSAEYDDYLEMVVGDNKAAISCRTPNGDYEADFDAETVGELRFGINARFLQDWLSAVGSARGKLMLRDENSLAKLLPVGQDNYTHVFGLMHLRGK